MPFDLLMLALPHQAIFEGICQLMLISFCAGMILMWAVTKFWQTR